MAKRKKTSAFTFKDTFWSRKRVDANITIVELAKLFGLPRPTMGAYLSGCSMPPEHIIKGLCDFFDVDPIVGEREFRNAHRKYDVENKKSLKATAKKPKEKKDPVEKTEKDIVIPKGTPIKVVGVVDNRKTIESAVYGTLSYDDFELFKARLDGVGDPLELIYRKVDYQTFRRVEKALERKLEPVLEVTKTEDNKWEI